MSAFQNPHLFRWLAFVFLCNTIICRFYTFYIKYWSTTCWIQEIYLLPKYITGCCCGVMFIFIQSKTEVILFFYHRKICKAETNGFGLVGLYLAPDNTTVSHQLWELLVLVVSILSRLFFVVSLCSSFFWSSLSPQEPIFPGSLIFSSSRDISLWASALMKPTWSGCIGHVI